MEGSTFYLIGRRIGGEINALKEVISGGGLPHAEMFVGMLAYFPTPFAPPGWLIPDGRAVSREQYAGLFAYLGTHFGPGDGVTTFNLPDIGDRYLRGPSDAYPVGGFLDDTIRRHGHSGTAESAGAHKHSRGTMNITGRLYGSVGAPNGGIFKQSGGAFTLSNSGGSASPKGRERSTTFYKQGDFDASRSWEGQTSEAGSHTHALNINQTGDDETRPKTFVGLLCIKY